MRLVDGRAAKAAQLHLVAEAPAVREDGAALWQAMGDRYHDRRGGDHWKSRGEKGIWYRVHTKPRKSLFTPYKVSKGPDQNVSIGKIRFTKGVTQSGHMFEFHDQWMLPHNAHRLLDEPWVGCTTFIEEGKADLLTVQLQRSEVPGQSEGERVLRWKDMLE
jgi:hypothetical protein